MSAYAYKCPMKVKLSLCIVHLLLISTPTYYDTPKINVPFFRAAFKFGRRVHFALRCKRLKSPIARLPAILLYFINRPRGKKDRIYEVTIK